MGVLGLIGLKTVGPYCFYTVGKDTAVLVGIKVKKGKTAIVPERIGKYTVRGIDDAVCSGPLGEAMNTLSEKALLRIQKKLNEYHRTSSLRIDQLPTTVEYIGFSIVASNGLPYGSIGYDHLQIPSHIRYIRELRPSIILHEIVLPSSLLYLGTLHSGTSLCVKFTGPGCKTAPVHCLSDYLGKPMEEVPQLGDNAFSNCPKMHTLKLPDAIEKIGKNAFPTHLELYNFSRTTPAFKLQFPKSLRHVDPEIFRTAQVSTLNYPEDLTPELRCRELPLAAVAQLIIQDADQLEEYIRLLRQGENPEQHPGKCLYHLIRIASRIVLPKAPKRICDGMFEGCENLYQVTIGSIPETDNTALTIAEGVEVIGNDAFASCHRLIPMPFPCSLRQIGDRAFWGSKVNTLALPEGLERIGKQAFAQCQQLSAFNIPATVKELSSDAFENCSQLRLLPATIQRLEAFPEAQHNIILPWKQRVFALIEEGNKLLFQNNVTIANKLEAYLQYHRALSLDPFCMDAMYSLEQLLLSVQVPHCVTSFELSNLRYMLQKYNSTALVEFFDSTLSMLDSICVILSDPEDLITQRLVYALNCDQTAAANLLRFLLDMVQQHPQITAEAKQKIGSIAGHIICTPTRNSDAESQKLFDQQKKRYQQTFPNSYYTTKMYNPVTELTSEKLMAHYHDAMAQDLAQSFRDAELWLQIARTLNPSIEIPKEFKNRQAKYRQEQKTQQWLKQQEQLLFPSSPVLPIASFHTPIWNPLSVLEPEAPTDSDHRYRDKEEEDRHNEIISEYWANVAAQKEAAEIESLWGDLADRGFWNDTSWQ